VLLGVDKCRRSSEIMVTYNPSFTSYACPSSSAAAAGTAGSSLVSTESSLASPASSRSSFSPQSICRPIPIPHTSSRDGQQAPPPLHPPHSVTGLCCCQCQTPLHGHRLRTCCTTPPTDKHLPHPNILTCPAVGLWHCDAANLLYNKL